MGSSSYLTQHEAGNQKLRLMKKLARILGILLVVVVVGITSVIAYIKIALPDVGDAPALEVVATPERIARGSYLANSVLACMDCHSTRDWSRFSGPIKPGTEGMGGERFDQSMGFPGVFYSRNITPAGIKRYTDGELYRLITTGVTKEGRAIFPVMPYTYYGNLDEEDVYSIIAYVRSLQAIENAVPASAPDFPMSIILNTIPRKNAPTPRPPVTDELAYGGYLVNAAACQECHTEANQGRIIPELAFGGGREFRFPDGSVVRSSNITPHKKTGIGSWTKENFIQRFKIYADSSYIAPVVNAGDFNTIMPWTLYATMTEQDLGAIYVYLQSLKPIDNSVVKYTAAPEVNSSAGL